MTDMYYNRYDFEGDKKGRARFRGAIQRCAAVLSGQYGGRLHYINGLEAMDTPQGLSSDGLHPSDLGHGMIAERLADIWQKKRRLIENMRTYKNPILYADYSDPDVVRVGRIIIWYPPLYLYSGVPLFTFQRSGSLELINHCVKKLPFEKYALPCHGSGTWAPSIRYHEGTFFVFIPLVDEGILVARSKDPMGNLNGVL